MLANTMKESFTQKNQTILLVEDNQDDIELTLRAFKKNNLDTSLVVTRNGEEALDYIYATGPYSGNDDTKRIRVVFLDLNLPKIDGLEVLRRLRLDERTQYLPVVILTSSDEERDMTECYNLGVNSYVRKPIGFEQFVSTVSQLGIYWLEINKYPAT